MAIKGKKTEPEKSSIPSTLGDMLLKGFSYQAIRDQYGDAFDAVKGDVRAYLEHNEDGFDVDLGKGFKCDQGLVCMSERSNYTYDKDKLIELVENGTITMATLIELASFPAEKLKTALGEKNFSSLATNKPTQTLTFKANAEFKEQVVEKFRDKLPKEEAPKAPKKVEAKVEAKTEAKPDPKAVDAKSKAAKAKAALAKTKTVTTITSVDDDLESILAGE